MSSLPKDENGISYGQLVIGNIEYQDKTGAAKALAEALATKVVGKSNVDIAIGTYAGMRLTARYDSFAQNVVATLKGSIDYPIQFGSSNSYNLKRLSYEINDMPNNLEKNLEKLALLKVEHTDALASLDTPFAQADALQRKSTRLNILNSELQEAAAQATQAKRNNPRTYYFSRRQQQKNKSPQKASPAKANSKDVTEL